MAVGKYFTFVIPPEDGKVTVSGDFVAQFGFKLKQRPEGYAQFRTIGFASDNNFVVEVHQEFALGRAYHRFLLQLQDDHSPDPVVDGNIVPGSIARGIDEYLGGHPD